EGENQLHRRLRYAGKIWHPISRSRSYWTAERLECFNHEIVGSVRRQHDYSTILLRCVRKGSVAARFGPQSGRGAVFAPAMGLAIGSEVRGQKSEISRQNLQAAF